MREKPIIESDERIVLLSDVKRLYNAMRKKLVLWAFFGGGIAFLFFASYEVKYKAEGVFQEGAEKTSPESVLGGLLGSFSAGEQLQSVSVMKSQLVLRPLVEKLGLQIQPIRNEWTVSRWLRVFKENIRAERGLKNEDLDSFRFENVHYDGHEPLFFHLSLRNDGTYRIFDEKKKNELAQGKLNEPSVFQGVKMTLSQIPEKCKFDTFYPFSVEIWARAVSSLKEVIQFKPDKENKSLIKVSIEVRDRYAAPRIVNELIHQYQLYLKNEYDHIAKKQLGYLEERQKETFGKMNQIFDEHAVYLSKSIQDRGSICSEQEMQTLLNPYQEMASKVLDIEVELNRLDGMKKNGKNSVIVARGIFSEKINGSIQKINELKQKRDLIELSLARSSEPSLQMRQDEMKEVRVQRLAAERLSQEIKVEGEISSLDVNPGLYQWATALRSVEEREDFANYLENYCRLLSIREKMLQERLFYCNQTPLELEGIDLETAQTLFFSYNRELDETEAKVRHYKRIREDMINPHFDLGSLSSVLQDGLCKTIISQASGLEIRLKDEKHFRAKEGERWKKEIALNKEVLSEHLGQLCQVEELKSNLIREKMAGLQSLSLDCINQQMSVQYEQVNDALKERRQALFAEKNLLEKKMTEIRASLASVMPEKWKFERWLGIKTSMLNKMMETITEIVESKTITSHLHHIKSKALDVALLPSYPVPPRLYRIFFLGAFVAAFISFLSAFILQFVRGFSVSFEKLMALKFPLVGQISAFCDGPSVDIPTGPDLETLRNISSFSEGAKIVNLISGNGPDYSYALGENLARRMTKSIILRCDFQANFRKEDTPGILQIWKGEIAELPIRKGKGFDYVTAGGYTPFGTEIIQSREFTALIEQLKPHYDWVFLFLKAPLTSAEATASLALCDKAIVTVNGEKTEELTPFIHWGYDNNNCRITFVTCS